MLDKKSKEVYDSYGITEAQIPEVLKGYRKAKGLTQRELAEIIGVSYTTISMWESGAQVPKIERFEAIAEYYHESLDTLFEDIKKESETIDSLEKRHLLKYMASMSRGFDGLPEHSFDACVDRVAKIMHISQRDIELALTKVILNTEEERGFGETGSMVADRNKRSYLNDVGFLEWIDSMSVKGEEGSEPSFKESIGYIASITGLPISEVFRTMLGVAAKETPLGDIFTRNEADETE